MRRFSGLHYPRITKKEKELEVQTEKSTGKTIIHRKTLKGLIRNQIKTCISKGKKV
jgi:hypothetical protein